MLTSPRVIDVARFVAAQPDIFSEEWGIGNMIVYEWYSLKRTLIVQHRLRLCFIVTKDSKIILFRYKVNHALMPNPDDVSFS